MHIGPAIALTGSMASAGVGAGGLPAPSRAPLTINLTWRATGNSTTFGVAAPVGQDWPAQATALRASGSGSVVNHGQSGKTSTEIMTFVTVTATPAQRSDPWIFGGGLNDYNTALGNIHNWPPTVKANTVTNVAAIAAAGAPDWFHALAPVPDEEYAGCNNGADHIFHARDMKATFGRHILDDTAWFRENGDPDPAGCDYFNSQLNGAIPLSFRGVASAAALTYSNELPIVSAGTPASLAYDAGRLAWNTSALKFMTKTGANGLGAWVDLDQKHFSTHGNSKHARHKADAIAASEGTGAPYATPWELKCAQDVAAGVIGYVPYTSAAEAVEIVAGNSGGQFSASLTTQTYSGESQPVVAISRTGTGSLTENEAVLWLRLGKTIGGVMRTLHSKLTVYVGQPSTQTVPRMVTIASPGIALSGRRYSNLTAGKVFSAAFLIKPSVVTGNRYLMAFNGGTNNGNLLLNMSDGRLNITAKNAANTTIHTSIVASGNAMVAGTKYWLLVSCNQAGALQVYHNETAVTPTPSVFVDDVIPFDNRSNPRFLCLTEPKEMSSTPGQIGDPVSAWLGDLGLAMFTTKGAIDWSNAANRRALFDNTGGFPPAARTFRSDVGSVAVDLEAWGSLGDLLAGTVLGLDDDRLLIPSHVARTRLSQAA